MTERFQVPVVDAQAVPGYIDDPFRLRALRNLDIAFHFAQLLGFSKNDGRNHLPLKFINTFTFSLDFDLYSGACSSALFRCMMAAYMATQKGTL